MSAPSFPVEERAGGAHPIAGVATAGAAFIGWAPRGPTDAATLVQSFAGFARQYGGLDSRSYLGYAVDHFFLNGGTQARIVRLAARDAVAAQVAVPDTEGGIAFTVAAIDPGQWANAVYGVRVEADPADADRFALLVVFTPAGGQETVVESFRSLSMDANDPRSRPVAGVSNDAQTGSAFIRISVVGTVAPRPNPSPAVAYAFPADGSGSGSDGMVLEPGQPEFHAALNIDGSAVNPDGTRPGVPLLDNVDSFDLLCVPGETDPGIIRSLQKYCRTRRAFYIVDCRQSDSFASLQHGPDAAISGDDAINAALYFPWVNAPDPLQQGRARPFPPCGFVAGIYAATDAARGVWKAPAGADARLSGTSDLAAALSDAQNETLNVEAINCLRVFPASGPVIWGARTLRGSDRNGSEWKYVPVRRLGLFVESSLYAGIRWVVFEPNNEALWSQIRRDVGAFMEGLFRQRAFQGTKPQQAYFVRCDAGNNPPSSISLGIVNIEVGFAPLKPAEFVIIQIEQMAGQS